MHLDEVPVYEALEFFYDLEDTHDSGLITSIEGNHLEILDEDLTQIFGLPRGSVHPIEYCIGKEKCIMRDVLLRPADANVTSGFTKPMFKRKISCLIRYYAEGHHGYYLQPCSDYLGKDQGDGLYHRQEAQSELGWFTEEPIGGLIHQV